MVQGVAFQHVLLIGSQARGLLCYGLQPLGGHDGHMVTRGWGKRKDHTGTQTFQLPFSQVRCGDGAD